MRAIRSMAAGVLWLLTTALLAVALPAMWAQQNLLSGSGYAALAHRAAGDPQLQAAMATELTTQVGRLSSAADATMVSDIAKAYTASASFPAQFAAANTFAHRWLFTDSVQAGVDPQGRWVIDLAPMLSDTAFAQTLRDYDITLATSVPIALTDNAPAYLRPGSLREFTVWGPWVSWSLAALTAATALLLLYTADRRGKALAALGVSALTVGAAGWAAMEVGRRYLQTALDDGTSGTVRRVADVMVTTAQDSMHQWLNVTLIVGGGLVLVGVIVSLLSGLSKHPVKK